MTIHPRSIPDVLIPGAVIAVRDNSGIVSKASFLEALGLAAIGAVEGVASPTGKLRFLRLVKSNFDMAAFTNALRAGSGTVDPERASSIGASTNIGVFRQRLGENSQWQSWTWKFCLSDRGL